MGSGLFISVFSSWEVILTALLLMFLLPLVFYVASTKSRPKKPVSPRPPRAKVTRAQPAATPEPEAEAEEDRLPGSRPRRSGPPEPKDDGE